MVYVATNNTVFCKFWL